MLEIRNVNVYNLEKAIKRSGLPMATTAPKCSDFTEKRINVASKLGSVSTGTGHDNFLKGIIVNFDLKYPEYFSPQLQRYSWIDIVSSQSKMHRLTNMDIKRSVNEYVDDIVINNLNDWIEIYNNFPEGKNFVVKKPLTCDGAYFTDKKEGKFNCLTKYEVFMKIVSNAPLGLEKWMNINTNYLQLKTILQQREDHKLKEDWGTFCEFIKSLPRFEELVLRKQERGYKNVRDNN